MHKRKDPTLNPADAKAARTETGRKAKDAKTKEPSQGYPALLRETVESVAIAFVLAFLFRTFEAEAFVIPTGSMATTLMGRHKDMVCPKCGYLYQVNASEEVNPNTGARIAGAPEVEFATCPMCRYTADIGEGNPQHRDYPSYKGDRILVGKFAYQMADPQRWDVAVFRYPGEAKMNFIKRIVGLPHETLRIHHGDLFFRHEGEEQFTIARKPPTKICAVLQPVYDNDYVLKELVDRGWPLRWQPVEPKSRGAWEASADFRSLATDGTAAKESWVRYHNYVPSPAQWQKMLKGQSLEQDPPKRQLISDFSSYNAGGVRHSPIPEPDSLGMHWVGDLALQCEVLVKSDTGQLILELVEGGRRFQCTLDVGTGQAELGIEGLPQYRPQTAEAIHGQGKYRLRFSNLDDELLLWINERVVKFKPSTRYLPLNKHRPQLLDLSPAAIGSRGLSLEVRHLKLWRDLYYIATEGMGGRVITDYQLGVTPLYDPSRLLSDPKLWSAFDDQVSCEFKLEADQFLVLGDNSPKSKDSRLWPRERFEYYVRRDLLIGKALFIYWPHSWDKIDIGGWEIPFPAFPNLARMRFIR